MMATTPTPSPKSEGQFKWGILATGGVARLFTKDLLAHGHHVHAVGSRSLASAEAFAAAYGIANAYGSYEELTADPDIDIIYIATPHNFHAANATLALENGKHILVEKTFAMTESQAEEITDLARRKELLVMEAMWTRFLPHMRHVRTLIESGRLGQVRSVHAEHAQRLPTAPTHRINNPHLAGGALLDLGIYPISFASDILGPAENIQARATFKASGVDGSVATIIHHVSGGISTSYSSSETPGSNTAAILGTQGRIEIASTWYAPSRVALYDNENTLIEVFDQPVSGRGMQYQAAEVEELIGVGATSSDLMSPAESVNIMATMDTIRHTIGLRYPHE
ncbi:Gfo/Idh/MocA family protein [Arthrobacter sp. D3-16]